MILMILVPFESVLKALSNGTKINVAKYNSALKALSNDTYKNNIAKFYNIFCNMQITKISWNLPSE